MTKIDLNKLYTTKEVSVLLNKHMQSINRHCRKWDIKCVKIFQEWRIKWEDLDLLINPK